MRHEVQRWGHNVGVEAQHKQVRECLNTWCPACWSAVAHRAWGQGCEARAIALLTLVSQSDILVGVIVLRSASS
jgi:hypothetical protein